MQVNTEYYQERSAAKARQALTYALQESESQFRLSAEETLSAHEGSVWSTWSARMIAGLCIRRHHVTTVDIRGHTSVSNERFWNESF